jgi:hypothetical protein
MFKLVSLVLKATKSDKSLRDKKQNEEKKIVAKYCHKGKKRFIEY